MVVSWKKTRRRSILVNMWENGKTVFEENLHSSFFVGLKNKLKRGSNWGKTTIEHACSPAS